VFWHHFMPRFCQDRLGIDIGKVENKHTISAGSDAHGAPNDGNETAETVDQGEKETRPFMSNFLMNDAFFVKTCLGQTQRTLQIVGGVLAVFLTYY
jgi:hypothetical protein